jgi:hypothetical protein
MNGLIAAHYLSKLGHNVVVVERREQPLTTWMGWKVLLDADSTRKLLRELQVTHISRQAVIGLRNNAGSIVPIERCDGIVHSTAQQWYAIRTRRTHEVKHGKRMPLTRSFLHYDSASLVRALSPSRSPLDMEPVHPAWMYNSVLRMVTDKVIRYDHQLPDGGVRTHEFAYDYLVSTIPFWHLAKMMMWVAWPIITAVDMTVSVVNKEMMSDMHREAIEPYNYIYLPFMRHLTRAANRGDTWHLEGVWDRYDPVNVVEEIEAVVGTHMRIDHHVPGQPFPQALDPEPNTKIPDNWLLMGRHAAWRIDETIDISMERLWKWMKQNSI